MNTSPQGPKDPNDRVLGPKDHECSSIWAFNPIILILEPLGLELGAQGGG